LCYFWIKSGTYTIPICGFEVNSSGCTPPFCPLSIYKTKTWLNELKKRMLYYHYEGHPTDFLLIYYIYLHKQFHKAVLALLTHTIYCALMKIDWSLVNCIIIYFKVFLPNFKNQLYCFVISTLFIQRFVTFQEIYFENNDFSFCNDSAIRAKLLSIHLRELKRPQRKKNARGFHWIIQTRV